MTHRFYPLLRLIWIDLRLEIAPLNREDICRAFGLSIPQASEDLAAYVEMNPKGIAYDPRAKVYRRPEHGRAMFPPHLRLEVQVLVMSMRRLMGDRP